MATPKKQMMISAAVVVGVIVGIYFAYQSIFYVSTDNANVQAQTTLLSSRISGVIVKAPVQENEKVKAGQVLVEIKPDDYQNVLDQLESDRASFAAQARGAEITYNRTLELFHKGASTQERLDTAETQLHSLQSKLKSAEAQAATARLNLQDTKILAPSDGKVGRKSFEVGMLASVGQPLLGFVEGTERWVVANLNVSVDAISGKEFQGVVESISPTTGATFSLLPPDNATGNFTKVVQRVPVRIKLLNLTDQDIDRLQSGLSAEVKIRVR
jgi:membrane fusion protein, multidrug efflux system